MGALLFFALTPPLYGVVIMITVKLLTGRWTARSCFGGWAWMAAGNVIGSLLSPATTRYWLLSSASALLALWLLKRPRRRDRAPKLSGAKGRALLAKLMSRLRPAPDPALNQVREMISASTIFRTDWRRSALFSAWSCWT
jgi:hypothetical protein